MALQIGAATFGILVLELALIRWTSQQVRVFAYFNNLTLMASFLGMGLGIAAGERRPRLNRWTLPILAVLSVVLGLAERLRITYLHFPDVSIWQWGGERWPDAKTLALSVFIVMTIFGLIVAVFVCAASIVGDLFTKLPPLQAYSADLLGSLLGVLMMTAIAATGAPPSLWFAVGALPFFVFVPRPLTALSFAVVLLMGWISVGGARFSPYNRIDLKITNELAGHPLELSVNRDFHQFVQNLSPAAVNDRSASAEERAVLRNFQRAYSLPFILTARRDDALVVGAGTGNDVAAALRQGFRHVVSVDIDPVIVRIGRQMHPEKPYSDPRASVVVNDARAYFEQNRGKQFDVVCFGLLDSHAMFSAMSSLRLENYVYTEQSIRSAWRMVKPGGVLTLSFSTLAGEWISDRLYATIWEATGSPPAIVWLPMLHGRMFIAGKQISPAAVLPRIPFPLLRPTPGAETIRVPTDDWPFLYIRPGIFPIGYVAVIGGLLAASVAGARIVFGRRLFTREGFDVPLFLMGAAFLLIETRGVVELSLLFGSTWLVNAGVFAGILLMAYLANAYVIHFEPKRLDRVFLFLFAALVLNYALTPAALLQLPLWSRGVIGCVVNALPVAFAGIIYSTIFRHSSDAPASLGSNLLGAVVGGCLEYLSVFIGLRALAGVALAIYFGVMLLHGRRPPVTA